MSTKTCKQCGKPITGGHYATPDGTFCLECWNKMPRPKKDKLLRLALHRFLNAPTLFTPPPVSPVKL